ncbi:hypothetical protein DL766_001436 [Monosporascus sp. MC13-8B]|uniref:Cupin type-2 domain-containing protein n=1 Tax=Monosporascus cannonballus TaxID=155416 RepID=A0ABY0HBK1_9PEZI|nr:hypothetical protein DL762_003072 [Monosporascus cannonballus]RYP00437.1 hypothetical protein DL763_000789 [Monosporascus cannonballus]RYP37620.1 hypothetical protein DL766_001436 [Monosporascus sp. MC13-8B]
MAAEDTKYDRSRPLPELSLAFQYRLLNSPGKSIVGVVVNFGPNASTPPHRHGGASVTGYVLEGTLLNKMNDEPTQVITTGGSWYEAPGCHHKISDNYSATEPAKLLATFVVDTKVVEEGGLAGLVQVDEEYRDVQLGM